MRRLRYWWRRLRYRCIECNRLKERFQLEHLHCANCDNPDLCHACGKRYRHSLAYGLDKAADGIAAFGKALK